MSRWQPRHPEHRRSPATNSSQRHSATREDNRIFGSDGANTFTGGAGDDDLDGGASTDAAIFAGKSFDYTVTNTGGANYTVVDNNLADGDDGTDTLANIETLKFLGDNVVVQLVAPAGATPGDDDLLGDIGNNTIDLLAGNDTYDGLGGLDDVMGNSGNDTVLISGSGNGVVTFDGGADTDTIDLSTFGSAVWVDLDYPGAEVFTRDMADLSSGAWRGLAQLSNVENIIGSAFADELTGDAGANRIEGGGGDDLIKGEGGNDIFDGGAGNEYRALRRRRGRLHDHQFRRQRAHFARHRRPRRDPEHDRDGAVRRCVLQLCPARGPDAAANVHAQRQDNELLPANGGTFDALAGDDVVEYTGGFVTLDGGPGQDFIQFDNFTSAVWVDLDHSGGSNQAWTRDQPDLSVRHVAQHRRSGQRRTRARYRRFQRPGER